MDFDKLVAAELLGILTLAVMFIQLMKNRLDSAYESLAPHTWLIALGMSAAASFGFAAIWAQYHVPATPPTMFDSWVMQAIIGTMWMALWNKASDAVYSAAHANRIARATGIAAPVAVLAFVFFVLSGANPVSADPLYDFKRVAAGADAGVVYAESLDPEKALEPGFRIKPYVSASISEQLSLVGAYGYDFTHERSRATAGARIAVVGFEPEDRVQAGLIFDRVWYGGAGADWYETKERWAGGIAMSWLAAKRGDRDAVYAKVQAAYDSANGYDVSLALGLNFIGGGN